MIKLTELERFALIAKIRSYKISYFPEEINNYDADEMAFWTDRRLISSMYGENIATRKQYETGNGFKSGEAIYVKNKSTPKLPVRAVTFEVKNGKNGIKVDNEWFEWNEFFEVNYI